MPATLKTEAGRDTFIQLAYECVRQPATWSVMLRALTDAVGAECAFLSERDGKSARLAFRSEGTLTGKTTDYDRFWARRDPCIMPVNRLGRGFVTTNRRAAPNFERTAFNNEYCRPAGRLEHLVINTYKQGHIRNQILIARQLGDRLYADEDLDSVRFLVPHLLLASELRKTIDANEETLDVFRHGLDEANTALFILTKSGVLAHCNGEAERMLETGAALRLVRGRLVGADRLNQATLEDMVARVSSGSAANMSARGLIRSEDGRTCLARANRIIADPSNADFVVLTVRPLNRAPAEIVPLLALFGLTDREAEIVAGLVDGHSAAELARRLTIQESTVRWHVRNALEKLGVRTLREAAFLLGVISAQSDLPPQN
ncbi:MAG: helix-turn-helix transcriptional regulator [Pseudomonadota bacterium]